jgi:asparagine synthase (glutamine-hydrolysing)
MCGIAGILGLAGGETPQQVLQGMAAALTGMSEAVAHRGPDGTATWISPTGRIGFAHRRLAIIDPSARADQPMQDVRGRYRIVFNGEIYNHAELRAELQAAGRTQWSTDHSDTEVILEAFAFWGIASLERLRGMFAFALWDDERRELWLVRDRIGIKPLYYARANGRLLFASEIKALLADRTLPRAVDETALFHFLSFLVPPAPLTMFAGVRKLPAGTWLRISADGTTAEGRYWDALDAFEPREGIGEDEAASLVLARLEESVAVHKVSDVPVGVFLSGGIDSSTNAVLFSRGEADPVRTFSIGYEGNNPSYPNELQYARMVAERIGAQHHELLLKPGDLEDFLPRMTRLQDEPIADPVCVPVYYVSKLAREHGVKVCHVGEGADELFAGYPYWRRAMQMEAAAALPLAGIGKALASGALTPFARPLGFRYDWLRRSARGQPVFWGGAEAFGEADKHWLLSPRLRADFRGRSSWEVVEPIWKRYRASSLPQHPLNWMAYMDLNLRLPELLLMRVDKMSMGVGLEARVPYLDHRFVEMALGIDPRLRIRGAELKYILKRAVRELLPPEILTRPKQGFGVPLREWMKGALASRVGDTLERFCRRADLLDPRAVRAVLARGRPDQSWYLFNLALWWDEFISA